jgi:hypothetical protein
MGGREVRQHPADVLSDQLTQWFLANVVGERLEGAAVEDEGLGCAAVEAVAQPVFDGLADRVAGAAIPALRSV